PPQHDRAHFVLVHGASHGAWCWYKLIPILKSQGHNVTAVDLAASGIDLRRAETLQSVAEYIGPLMDLMESLSEDEKVILVAHSFGGLAISKAMEIFHDKVHMAIFVTALMPGPTFNFTLLSQGLVRWQAPQLDLKFVFGNGPNKSPTIFIRGPLSISLTMYDLSPNYRFGSVNRIFVVSEKDKSLIKELIKEFQLWMIKNNPPNQVEYIQDSDHMVMISRPLDLGARLLSLANKFA
ncbi:hypothetical protein EUTSA_v10021911mg, partial [Eutrema salsugineum]